MGHLRFRFSEMVHSFPLVAWLLGVGSFINVGGLSLLWPVNSIYIHNVLGQPLTVAGVVLMLNSAAGFVGSFFGGWLCDRIGTIRVLAIGLTTSAVVIWTPVLVHSWWSYVAVMIAFGATCAMPFPAMNTLIGHAWPEGGRRAYNFIYVSNNLGVAAGTAIGGVLAQWSFHAVFVGISLAYTIYLTFVLTVLRTRVAKAPHAPSKTEAVHLSRADMPSAPWVPLLFLFAGFVLSWSIYVQWQCTISVYMASLGFPLASYSLLWTINGLLIFGLQPLVSVVVRRQPNLSVHMCGGVILYAISFGALLLAHQYMAFLISMGVLTCGEIFVWPAVPAVVAKLAPPHRLGLLQGMVNSAATGGRMIGPVMGGALYDHTSIHFTMLVIVLGSALPLLCYWLFSKFTAVEPRPMSEEFNL